MTQIAVPINNEDDTSSGSEIKLLSKLSVIKIELSPSEFDYFCDLERRLYGEDEKFLEQYNSCPVLKEYNAVQISLLQRAVAFNKCEAVLDAILSNVSDINGREFDNFPSDGTFTYHTPSLIESVLKTKNMNIFRRMIEDKQADSTKLMKIAGALFMKDDLDEFKNYFDVLLENLGVNECDSNGETLLDKALYCENSTAIRYLLDEGAYIGSRGCFENIHLLEPKDLENAFNSRIYIYNMGDNYSIQFYYNNLAPPKDQINTNEMNPIMVLISSKQHLHLLKHPLIMSFMHIKWLRIEKFLYINLLFFCFYLASIIAYVILLCAKFGSDSTYVTLTWWLTAVGIVGLIFREAVQFVLSDPKKYVCKLSNYMELLLIIQSIWILTMDVFNRKEIVVSAIILMAVEFWILVGYLPILNISTHMIMLKEVLKTFLQSFALYSIFVFMFALSFFVLFGNEHNKFGNIFTSVVKTMAMIIGELDFENLEFDKNVFGYVLFLMFAICMTLVLTNLLNGLAVSDIQAIREEAEYNGLICRANFLRKRNCRLLLQHHDDHKCLCQHLQFGIESSLDNISNKVIFPEQMAKCIQTKKIKKNKMDRYTERWSWLKFFQIRYIQQIVDSWLKDNMSLDSSIVTAARNTKTKTKKKDIIKQEVMHLKTKTENIEQKIIVIEEKIQSIVQATELIGRNVEKLLLLTKKNSLLSFPSASFTMQDEL